MPPGTYIQGDANQVTLGSQRLEDCALAVVSTAAPDRTVADGGSKARPIFGLSDWTDATFRRAKPTSRSLA